MAILQSTLELTLWGNELLLDVWFVRLFLIVVGHPSKMRFNRVSGSGMSKSFLRRGDERTSLERECGEEHEGRPTGIWAR